VACVKTIVTNLGLLTIEKGKFLLKEVAPGVDIEYVKSVTEGELVIDDSCKTMLI